jgi:hypothetical protein
VTNGVDLDRLADYTAGLLEGTPEEAEVAELIATRSDWAHAYAALGDATRAVRVDLAALGTPHLAMPPEVVARLDAALEEAGARPKLTVGAGEGRRTRGAAARARRRRQAWTAAIAAGIVVLAGFGVAMIADLPGANTGTSTVADGRAPEAAADRLGGQPAPPAGAPEVAVPVFVASGTNYFAADAAKVTAQAEQFDAGVGPLGGATGTPRATARVAESQVAPPLRRLMDPVAMNACLRQVTSVYGGQVSVVDFARFENEPALVILLVDPARRPVRVMVAGPGCGLPERGADVRFSTSVA